MFGKEGALPNIISHSQTYESFYNKNENFAGFGCYMYYVIASLIETHRYAGIYIKFLKLYSSTYSIIFNIWKVETNGFNTRFRDKIYHWL